MLAQIVVSGLALGAIYALIAIGFTVVFSTNRLVNFAHGEFVMAGGMLYAWLTGVHHLPVALAFLAATALCGAIGFLVYQAGLAGVDRDNHIAQVMITLGAGIALKGAAQVVLGKDTLFPPSFSGDAPLQFVGISVPSQAAWIAIGMLGILGALHALMRYTSLGAAMRAVSINHYAATLMGISPGRAAAVSFLLAGLIGGAAGGLLSPLASANYDSGIFLAIKGFAAAIVGGIGSPLGAVVGGLILGLAESLAAGYLSSVYKDVVSLAVLITVLLVRPQGLLGKPLPQKL